MLMGVPGLKKLDWPVAGGVDEVSTVTDLAAEDYLYLMNWRISKDNKRLEKRLGVADQSITYGEDIFNYFTYYNSSSQFCEIIAGESKLSRRVAGGAWSDIHSWGYTLAHPIKPIMVNGKIYYIWESTSRYVDTDGGDYQIGITAPTTLPTLTASAGGIMPAGTYRYAVSYVHGGNYGYESNPIKAVVGSVTFSGGGGLNDCTSGGTYTGTTNLSVKVQIDGTGATDTFKYSLDGGTTWASTGILLTSTSYLSYGIQLTWGATTGHTLADYWTFTASACAVAVTEDQKVTLTSIPTSGDAQVTQRKIYRTTIDGAKFYWLATIPDNVTTTFVDNIEDSALGDLMEEDRDVCPNGKFAEYWDDRMWVADADDNILYYSEIDTPEEWDTSVKFIKIRNAGPNDEITGIIAYKDNLYVFKKSCIYAVQAYSDGTYGVFLCNKDFGCVAPWSLTDQNNLLMFLSYRGFELYNGCESYANDFSIKIGTTVRTIDPVYYDKISATHNRPYHEVWFSCPDIQSGGTALTIIYNYESNKWLFSQFSKVPSCLVEAKNSSKITKNYMGTRDGYLGLCDSGYQDFGTNITATGRKGWLRSPMTMLWKRIDIEHETPDSKTLTWNCYIDFDKDSARASTLTGVTPSATDLEYRRPIIDFQELGLRGKHFSVGFSNAENVGGNLKLNGISVYCAPMAVKGKIYGD